MKTNNFIKIFTVINEADYIPKKITTTTTTHTSSKIAKKEKESKKNIKKDNIKTSAVTFASNNPLQTQTTKRRNSTFKTTNVSKATPTITTNTQSSSSSSSTTTTTIKKKTPTTNTSKNTATSDTKAINKKDKDEKDELKGLEDMYYGILDGIETYYEIINVNLYINCTICLSKEQFHTNIALQKHLLMHININNDNDNDNKHQCLYCLKKFQTADNLIEHEKIIHPNETRTSNEKNSGYNCLICEKNFNSLQNLSGHLQKLHNMLELPYNCQACNYRSSSHNDIILHFYNQHKQNNFLQCPYCLDIFHIVFKGLPSIRNIEYYYYHLMKHLNNFEENSLQCTKCVLKFNEKGLLKQHTTIYHVSMMKNSNNIRPMLINTLLLPMPKIRTHHREALLFTTQEKNSELFIFTDNSICLECNSEIINDEKHFAALLKCNKCNYKTYCERAIYIHTLNCIGEDGLRNAENIILSNELHCICGFSSNIGNKIAQHLSVCGQKSAYSNVQLAVENTVKRSMLDMLGLMRRDGETIVVPNEENNKIGSAIEIADKDEQFAQIDNDFPILYNNDFIPSEVTSSTEIDKETQILTINTTTTTAAAAEIDANTNAIEDRDGDIDMPFLEDLADTTSSAYLGDVQSNDFTNLTDDQPQQLLLQQQQQQQQQSNTDLSNN